MWHQQHPYPQARESWLPRRPRGPGRPALPSRALGACQARVAFVAGDARVPRRAFPTRSSFVTLDAGISLEGERRVGKQRTGGALGQGTPILCLPERRPPSVPAQVRTWSPGGHGHPPRSHRWSAGDRTRTLIPNPNPGLPPSAASKTDRPAAGPLPARCPPSAAGTAAPRTEVPHT